MYCSIFLLRTDPAGIDFIALVHGCQGSGVEAFAPDSWESARLCRGEFLLIAVR